MRICGMPIYEYRCRNCGNKQEELQKVSDAPITLCKACQTDGLDKMISAAGFQLKGSGWYATDFKSKPAAVADKPAPKADDGSKAT